MKKSAFLLVGVMLALSAGVAMAQSTFTVPFSPTGNSGVEGSAVLTASGEGTDITLDITGLAPGTAATATLHAGTCAAPSASVSRLPNLTADASGRATAAGHVLYRDTDPVSLASIADGEHVMAINQSGQTVACAWIPNVQTSPTGMPRTGSNDTFLPALGLVLAALGVAAAGLVLRWSRMYQASDRGK